MCCRSLITIFLVSKLVSCLEIGESTGERVECDRSKIDHNVTLSGGHQAGLFLKANKSISTMKRCIKQCCNMNGCDVAYFSNNACYSVKCRSLEACAPKSVVEKGMSTEISYVAKPKVLFQGSSSDETGEPAIVENLIAEVVSESPFPQNEPTFLNDDKKLVNTNMDVIHYHKETWKETKNMIGAVVCAFIAVLVGVLGVITMTRKLVEDDEEENKVLKENFYMKNTLEENVAAELKEIPKSRNTFVRKIDNNQIEHSSKIVSKIPVYKNKPLVENINKKLDSTLHEHAPMHPS
ncbi:uncharacterized protein LOC100199026 [Hydra vulgaris]|uniref:uncharacterized protein LOC100199026 n=1 Tax=Hydra vulgaris TaxID=6087 RepID=UPI0001923D9E|nr:uncharacterized protein LOC100199026 [Hydra vulgaris]XP_047125770.1 uncharacterized protein LOC100199026 [Hydra vulgaris]